MASSWMPSQWDSGCRVMKDPKSVVYSVWKWTWRYRRDFSGDMVNFRGSTSLKQNILGDSEDWLTLTFSFFWRKQQQPLGEQKHSIFFVGILSDNETARFVKFWLETKRFSFKLTDLCRCNMLPAAGNLKKNRGRKCTNITTRYVQMHHWYEYKPN